MGRACVDGAGKRRWIALPPGTAIDGSDPDGWIFPVGTRLWKEFAFDRRVETRYLERTSEGWRFATYLWLADVEDLPDHGLLGRLRPGDHLAPGTTSLRAVYLALCSGREALSSL